MKDNLDSPKSSDATKLNKKKGEVGVEGEAAPMWAKVETINPATQMHGLKTANLSNGTNTTFSGIPTLSKKKDLDDSTPYFNREPVAEPS